MTDAMPQNPTEAARNALAAGAAEMAENRLRRELKSRIPRFLHPLIPGEGGTVREAAEKEARRAASRMVSNLIWSLVFFLIFGAVAGTVLLFVGAIIVYVAFSILM